MEHAVSLIAISTAALALPLLAVRLRLPAIVLEIAFGILVGPAVLGLLHHSELMLVLAEIGARNNVQVTEQEMNAALIAEARRYPGQERQVIEFYRQNPNASAQLRAPVYEEKVVDLIFAAAKITDKPVSKDELLADDDLPEGYAA